MVLLAMALLAMAPLTVSLLTASLLTAALLLRRCHGCFYPTGEAEQIFQLYFPAKTMDENWGTLSPDEGRKQCGELAATLRADGWDDALLAPLLAAEGVIRVGLFSRDPLDTWSAGGGRVVLLGDAAHPPVPYIGQGAMMAMEDAGVLAKLLQHYCCAGGTSAFESSDANLAAATAAYEAMRIPRTRLILGASHKLGATQQRRAESKLYNLARELSIRAQVAFYGTLPMMKPGAAYNYADDVAKYLKDKPAEPERASANDGKVFAGVALAAAAVAAVFIAAKKRV
jgi:hypothetical protein